MQPMTPAKDTEFNDEVDLLDSSNSKQRRLKMRKTHGQFNENYLNISKSSYTSSRGGQRKPHKLSIKTNSNASPLSNGKISNAQAFGHQNDGSMTGV